VLKVIKIDQKPARIALGVIALLCLVVMWFLVRWHFANTIASRLDADRPESRLVADWLIGVAPHDPQTHFAAATIFERTFDEGDLERSLAEYETAASLSPEDFRLWLHIARSRTQLGDAAGAETAFRRAAELAPNYTAVHWAFGNFLVRQGSVEAGFVLMARAADKNPDYARAGVITAMELFEDDIEQTRRALGDSDAANAALALHLAAAKRFAESAETWSRVPAAARNYKALGEKLYSQFIEAKQYRAAARVSADMQGESGTPAGGRIANGDFEEQVKLRGAGLFEWNVSEGVHPQIGLNESQKRSGRYSLILAFDSFESAAYRNLSQTVPVEPGAIYEFQGFYRFDLKSTAKFKWEIVDPVAGVIAATEPLTLAGDWTTLRARFTVPAGSDGIVLRFTREGCSGPTCPTSGRIFFDDFSIRKL